MPSAAEEPERSSDGAEEAFGPGSSKQPMLLLDALKHWTGLQGSKTLATWVDEKGQEATRLSYEEVEQQASALASFLLASGQVQAGEPVLLVYPPSLDFLVAFLACLRAGLIAVPVYPPEPGQAQRDLRMFVAVQASSGAKVALTITRYSQAKQLDDLRSFFLLTQQPKGSAVGGSSQQWPSLQWIATDSRQARSGSGREESGVLPELSSIHADDIAFLQYTSGSTSEPKGVMVTHGNLSANLQAIVTALRAGSDTVVASWLPQYHDMGLIGAYLGALYCGGCGFYMSPLAFIRDPSLWIRVMAKYRATHIQAPNFAYSLSARKFSLHQRRLASGLLGGSGGEGSTSSWWSDSLDLSSVRHMINGAEPVDPRAMDEFYHAFQQFGLSRGVIFPTYGLAENTVFVASNGRLRLSLDRHALEHDGQVVECPSGGRHVVGCGDVSESARLGIEVVVADPQTGHERPEGRVGEIWVRGPSRAMGYLGREEQSRDTFGARLIRTHTKQLGDEEEEEQAVYQHKGRTYVSSSGFLRTGDQGFVYRNEVFITGRLKDLIIVRGRNMYPQDLERGVEAALANDLRAGCSAAFTMARPRSNHHHVNDEEGDEEEQEEILALAAEVRDESGLSPSCAEALGQCLRRLVSVEHGASLAAVFLLKPRSIPKTTSGKIARSWVRKAAEEGRLQTLFSWVAPSDQHDEEEGEQEVPAAAGERGEDDQSGRQHGETKGATEPEEEEEGSVAGKKAHDAEKSLDAVSLQEVVITLTHEVARITKDRPSSISVDVPLSQLGLDSLQGMQLHSLMEQRFGLPVPEAVMFDKDTTLTVLAHVLKRRGVLPTPVTLVDLAHMAGLLAQHHDSKAGAKAKQQRRGSSAQQQAEAAALGLATSRSSLLTGRFPPHHLRSSSSSSSPSPWHTRLAFLLLRLLVNPLPMCGPALALLLAAAALLTSLPVALLLVVIWPLLIYHTVSSVLLHPTPLLPGGLRGLLFRYFSFKVAYEGTEGLPQTGPLLLMVVDPTPHQIPVAQILLSLAFPSLFSRPLAGLCDGERPVSPVHSPFLSRLLTALHMQHPSSRLPALLKDGQCVAVPAAKDGTSKPPVSAALQAACLAGARLVPCLVLSTPTALDRRSPITVLLGTPIPTEGQGWAPDKAHAAVVAEAQRMFEQHKVAWGLDEAAQLGVPQ